MNWNASWIARRSLLDAEVVAKVIADEVFKGKPVIIPGVFNRFLLLLDKLLPEIIKQPINNYQMKKLQFAKQPVQVQITPVLQKMETGKRA
jgi:hypothetical protein